ncbi:hypothetical protein [Mycoplasma sp. OR1901]|uniref:hypothetical protein n=1 Tax=Mycoplasma sp. OR1901 TaxID=2742195 RepID=UPI00158314E3|nr:hypothetical protein [Mycoplasma sp. OR1901]QKT05381.1 hypothetical protein HTZ87_01545 [Mycoplasma sp. OR1901]
MSSKYKKIFINLMAGSMLLGSTAALTISCSNDVKTNKKIENEPNKPVQPDTPVVPGENTNPKTDNTENEAKTALNSSLEAVKTFLESLNDPKYTTVKDSLNKEYQKTKTIFSDANSTNEDFVNAKASLDKAHAKAVESKKSIDQTPSEPPVVEENNPTDQTSEKENTDTTKDGNGTQTPPATGGTETKEPSGTDTQNPPKTGGEETKKPGDKETPPATGGTEIKEPSGTDTQNPAKPGTETPAPGDKGTQTPNKGTEGTTTPPTTDGPGTPGQGSDGGETKPKTDTEAPTPGDKGNQTPPTTGGSETPGQGNADAQTPPATGGDTQKTPGENTEDPSNGKNTGDSGSDGSAGSGSEAQEPKTPPKQEEVLNYKEINYEHVDVKKILSNTNISDFLSTTYPNYTFANYDSSEFNANRLINDGEKLKLVGTKTEGQNTKYTLLTLLSSRYNPNNLNDGAYSNVLTGNQKLDLNIDKSYYDYHNPKKPNESRRTELPKMIDGNKDQASRWDNWFDYAEIQNNNVFYLSAKEKNGNKIHGLKAWTRVSAFTAVKSWGDFEKYDHNAKVELQNGKTMSPEWIKVYSSPTLDGEYKLVSGQNKITDSDFFDIKIENNYRLIDETKVDESQKVGSNIYLIHINFKPTTDKFFKIEFEAPTIPNLKDPEGTQNPKFKSNKGFTGFSELELVELKNDDASTTKATESENKSVSFEQVENFNETYKLIKDSTKIDLNQTESSLELQIPDGSNFKDEFKKFFDAAVVKNADETALNGSIYTFGYISGLKTNSENKEVSAKAKVIVTDGTADHRKEFVINLTKAQANVAAAPVANESASQ